MKNKQYEELENIKKGIDYIIKNGSNVSISYEQKLEDLYSTYDMTVARGVLEIRIEYNDEEYVKNNNGYFTNWERYEDYVKKQSRDK